MIGAGRPWAELVGSRPGPCLGAVFTTFGFDPRRFEERVLPALLDLRHDPQEDTLLFLSEARARIREVPVAVVADGRQASAGQRIPYDLVRLAGRTFHPKVAVLVFPEVVRLVVGSANLTAGGLGENTELCFTADLAFAAPEDRRLLEDVRGFLRELHGYAGSGRIADTLAELERRLVPLQAGEGGPRLLHSLGGPLFPALEAAIGPAELTRISVLAPFYEEDGEALEASVLHRFRELAEQSGGGKVLFEVGLPWDDNPLAAVGEPPEFETRLGELWGYYERWAGGIELEYFLPTRVTAQRVFHETAHGAGTYWERDEAEEYREVRGTFPVGEIRTFGPAGLLDELAAASSDLTFWLFPARRIEPDRVVKRPLHGKLLLLGGKAGRTRRTWAVAGSANLSRRAWLEAGGNVEAVVVLPLDGEYGLAEVAPQLVRVPRKQLRLEERQFVAPPFDPARVVQAARYHAAARRLELTWNEGVVCAGGFRVVYPGPPERLLIEAVVAPESDTVIEGFELGLASAELVVTSGTGSGAVPIEVVDPAALPADPVEVRWELEQLLERFGSRWGRGEVVARVAGGGPGADGEDSLAARGFVPTDVFRAFHGLSEELSDPLLTLGGLRVLLDGTDGARAIWRRLLEAVEQHRLPREEGWFHGLELVRTLRGVQFEEGPDAAERRGLLGTFVGEVLADVARLEPSEQELPALPELRAFYRVEAT